MHLLGNPNLLCVGCEGGMGPAYEQLYRVARHVMEGTAVPDDDLFAAVLSLDNIGDS